MKHQIIAIITLGVLLTGTSRCGAQSNETAPPQTSDNVYYNYNFDSIWPGYEHYNHWKYASHRPNQIVHDYVRGKVYTVKGINDDGSWIRIDSVLGHTSRDLSDLQSDIQPYNKGINWDHAYVSRYLDFKLDGAVLIDESTIPRKDYDWRRLLVDDNNRALIYNALIRLNASWVANLDSIRSIYIKKGVSMIDQNFLYRYCNVFLYHTDHVHPSTEMRDNYEIEPNQSFYHIDIFNALGNKIFTLDEQLSAPYYLGSFVISDDEKFLLVTTFIDGGEGSSGFTTELILYEIATGNKYVIDAPAFLCDECYDSRVAPSFFDIYFSYGLFNIKFEDYSFVSIDPYDKVFYFRHFESRREHDLIDRQPLDKPLFTKAKIDADPNFKKIKFK
jgi:hypothetical protein